MKKAGTGKKARTASEARKMWLSDERARRLLELADSWLGMTPFQRMFHRAMGRQMTPREEWALEAADHEEQGGQGGSGGEQGKPAPAQAKQAKSKPKTKAKGAGA